MLSMYFYGECCAASLVDALGRGQPPCLDLRPAPLPPPLPQLPLTLLLFLLFLFFSFSFYSSFSSSCSSLLMCGAELGKHFITEPCPQPSHFKWIRLHLRKSRRSWSAWETVRRLLLYGKTKREAALTDRGLRSPGLHSGEESEKRGCTQLHRLRPHS